MMTARELWEELDALRRERPDFDALDVYVDIIDLKSYTVEQNVSDDDEYTEHVIGAGEVFGVVVPTNFALGASGRSEPVLTYLLIRAVEEHDDDEAPG